MFPSKTFRTFALAVACALFMTTHAVADAPKPVNVVAGSLTDALETLAKQCGVDVIYPSNQLKGLTTEGVSGVLETRAAFRELLKGTRLVTKEEGGSVLITLPTKANTADTRGEQTVGVMRLAQAENAQNPNNDPPSEPSAEGSENDDLEENSAAAAATESKDSLQEVLVTGSHIRGLVNKTTPTIVLDRDYIEASGVTTTTRLMESLPQNFALANQSVTPGNPPGLSSENMQGSSINLRGLGEGTTLILLNGRRLPLGFLGGAADISALPLSAIERVEVLTDGASALYGSDAVGGVVNFVLRRDFEQAETRLRSGWADGADEYRLSQVLGTNWDTGNVIVSAEYYSRDLLESRERDFVPDTVMVQSLLPDDENLSAMLAGRQRLGSAVEIFADALYTQRDTSNRSDRLGTISGITFDGLATGDNTQLSIAAGADWRVTDSWRVETSVSFGSNEVDMTSTTRIDYPTAQQASTYETRQLEIKADGALFQLPGGPLRAALGAAVRAEDYESALTQFGTNRVNSDQKVKSLYAELNVPLVGDANATRGLHAVELSLAARYDDYSRFGSSIDPRIGLTWEPAPGLRMRGSWGTSYVAPRLSSYDPSFNAAGALFAPDPVASGVSYQLVMIGTNTGGLAPQESESYSLGLDFEPPSVPGLKMGLGYFDVDYTNKIATPPADSLLLLGNPAAYGSLFIRDPTAEQVEAVIAHGSTGQGLFAYNADFSPNTSFTPDQVDVILDLRRQNLSKVATRGIDFNLHYDRRLAGRGAVYFDLNAAYLFERPERVTATSAPLDTVNTIFYPTATRLRGGTGWRGHLWSVNGFLNYTGSYDDNRFVPAARIGSFTTVDANVSYRFAQATGPLSGVSVSLGAQNVFNRDPPATRVMLDFVGSTFDMGFDPTNANPLGRLLSLELVKTWN